MRFTRVNESGDHLIFLSKFSPLLLPAVGAMLIIAAWSKLLFTDAAPLEVYSPNAAWLIAVEFAFGCWLILYGNDYYRTSRLVALVLLCCFLCYQCIVLIQGRHCNCFGSIQLPQYLLPCLDLFFLLALWRAKHAPAVRAWPLSCSSDLRSIPSFIAIICIFLTALAIPYIASSSMSAIAETTVGFVNPYMHSITMRPEKPSHARSTQARCSV